MYLVLIWILCLTWNWRKLKYGMILINWELERIHFIWTLETLTERESSNIIITSEVIIHYINSVFWFSAFTINLWLERTSLVAQTVKRLPTMRETQVQSLGREDPLEKEMAPHSSTLAWKIPWTEERGRLQSMGSQRVGHDWATSLSLSQ